jgi:rubrerythrin
MPELLAWIRYAIEFEEKFLNFYKDCYENVKEDVARELFKFLIAEETRHKQILTEVLDWSSEGNQEKMEQSISEFIKFEVKIPSFSKEGVQKLSQSDVGLNEIINQAMKFEEQGISFYLDLVDKENDPNIKSFLRRLANDERDHKKVIQNMGATFLGMNMI